MSSIFRHFAAPSFSSSSREETVLRIATLGMLLGMACSWPLWINRVSFPLLPLWGEARLQGVWVTENTKAAATLLLLLAFLWLPRNRPLHGLALLWVTGLVLMDLNRLQPWVWFYGLLWLLVWPPKEGAERVGEEEPVLLLPLLASLYAWGGFFKLTPYFVEGNWPWFCDAFELTKPLGAIAPLGYLPAAGELLLGLALLSHKTRAWAARLLIALHVLILIFLLKIGWNWVVVPWNLALIGLLWPYLSEKAAAPALFSGFDRLSGLKVVLLLFPALSFFSLLPHNLSWKLYDNTQAEAVFYSEAPVFQSEALQTVWQRHSYEAGTRLYLGDWCQAELHVPPYPEANAFAKTGRYLCRQLASAKDTSGLWMLRVWPWDKGREHEEKWPCEGQ